MKYLKLFNDKTNYNTWLDSYEFVTPYVVKTNNDNNVNYQEYIFDTQIEYLEATGYQYIDTNIIYDGNYRFKVKFICNSLISYDDPASASIFGSRLKSNSNTFQLSTFRNGSFSYNTSINERVGINTINKEYVVEFKRNGELYVNDVLKLTVTNKSFNTPNSILLFALDQNSDIIEKFIGRIYYFTLYDENDNAIIDLIPVKKNNVGYMYDKVSKQLFSNQGTGEFILGPDL